MQRLVLDVAGRVIRRSGRNHPADAVLRTELRDVGNVTAEQRREITNAVFTYFRWFGWLHSKSPVSDQVIAARKLADAFAAHPTQLSDQELVSRAIPAWLAQYMEITPAWARQLQQPPKLWLRARKGQGTQLAARLGDAKLSANVPDSVDYFGSDDLFRRPEFKNGDFEIQDIASQMVSHTANPQAGETWWDACAGEGGKTLHFSDLMDNKGLIWASDRAAWRLDKLKRRAARACVFNYRLAPWDGSSKLPTRTKFDGILVDAPCSGLGTWQRNPHARWTTTSEDIAELATVQRTLLTNVVPSLKSGGRLIYAVCTMTHPETTEVQKWFGERFSEFSLVSATMLKPEETGGNGMFVAIWKRS